MAITRPRLDRLDALDRPADDDLAIGAWLQVVRRQVALTDQLGRAFTARDESTIARLSESVDAQDKAGDDLAAGLGLTACVALG